MKESSTVSRPDSRASTVTQRTGLNRLANDSPALSDMQRTSITPLPPAPQLRTPVSAVSGNYFQASFPSRIETSSSLSMRPPSIVSPDIERVRASSAMDSINRQPLPSAGLRFKPPPPPRTLQSPLAFNQSQSGYGQQFGLGPSQMPHDRLETRHVSNAQGASQTDEAHLTHSHDMRGRHGECEIMSSTVEGMSRPEETGEASTANNASSHYFSMGSMLRRSSTALSSQAANLHGYEPLIQHHHHSLLNDSMCRPMSTPLTGSQYDMSRLDISSWIPPKRDLPFPKAKEPKKLEAPVAAARQVTLPVSPIFWRREY